MKVRLSGAFGPGDGSAHLAEPGLQLQHPALVALFLLAHFLQMLLQFGVLGLQFASLRLQVELLLTELGDHFLLRFPAKNTLTEASLRRSQSRFHVFVLRRAYMFFWV